MSDVGDIKGEIISFFKDLAIIIIIVLVIRTFLFVPFQISGSSMDKSYYDREFIIVDKFSQLTIPYLKNGAPSRGDVIVFKPHVSKDKEYFIKRIIGLPGDTLKIEGGKVYLKGNDGFVEMEEGYLSSENKDATFISGGGDEVHEFVVPVGGFFVMGDNRNSSTDSRTCFRSCSYPGATNYITQADMSGKVWIDLGYYDWIRIGSGFKFSLGTFSFIHPTLGIDTHPKWFSSADSWEY